MVRKRIYSLGTDNGAKGIRKKCGMRQMEKAVPGLADPPRNLYKNIKAVKCQ